MENKELQTISETNAPSLDDLRRSARQGLVQDGQTAQPDAQTDPATTKSDEEPSSSAQAKVETPAEGEQPKADTSTSSGQDEQKDFWDQYKTDDDRRKALNETKRYAAEQSRKAKELEDKLKSLSTTETKETPKVDEKPSTEVPDVESLDVDGFIESALSLKDGHSEDQRRIALANAEVLRIINDELKPAQEKLGTSRETLQKANDSVRDQKAVVAKLRKKAEANATFTDDLKEEEAELERIERVATNARLDFIDAKESFSEVSKKEQSRRLAARELAGHAVEKLKTKSRDEKAQKEKADRDKAQQEESNKLWLAEVNKAITDLGLKDLSEDDKEALEAAAEARIRKLAQAGTIKSGDDLQPHLKKAMEPYVKLSSRVPVVEGAVNRKKDVADEPGPANRQAKTGEEQPKSLEELFKSARQGMKNTKF